MVLISIMAKYSVYAGPVWLCDVDAESQDEALEKGKQYDPTADTVQIVSELPQGRA
jgi:hypothetical protein